MSTVSSATSSTLSMWDSVLHMDEGMPDASESLKLTPMRVPQDTSQAFNLPTMQIWQDAVEFDNKLEKQLRIEAEKKKLAAVKSATEKQTGTSLLAPSQSAQTEVKARGVYLSPTADDEEANRIGGYTAQGAGISLAQLFAPRPGSLLDVLA